MSDREKPVHPATVSSFRMRKDKEIVGDWENFLTRLGPNRFVLLGGSESMKPKVMALGDSVWALRTMPMPSTVGDLIDGGVGVYQDLRMVKMRTPEEILQEFDWISPKSFDDDNKPMVGVDWYESVAYALLHGGRLALEAEREYAASCGGKYKFGTKTGTELRRDEANFHPSEGTTPVDRYPPNAWGFRDMSGNAWEWCMDRFMKYLTEKQIYNDRRVFRGGSWSDGEGRLRASYRFCDIPDHRIDNFGFRVVVPQDFPT